MTSEEEVKTNSKEESDCEIISSEGEKVEVKQESDCEIISSEEEKIEVKQESDCGIISVVMLMIKLLSIIMVTQVFQYLYLVNIHLRLLIFLIY